MAEKLRALPLRRLFAKGSSVSLMTSEGDKYRSKPLVEWGIPEEVRMPFVIPHYKNGPELAELRETMRNKIHKTDIQLIEMEDFPDMLLECPSTVEILDQHESHPPGQSKYLVNMRIGNDILHISTLGPGMLTSGLHMHAENIPRKLMINEPEGKGPYPGTEYYRIVYGMAILHHVEGDKGFGTPQTFHINPGIDHMMEGGPKGAIFEIWMKNAALYPPQLRHLRLSSL